MSKICYNNQITELNDISLYSEGFKSINESLKIAKTINSPINEPYNIFVYWIGDNVNYKHSVVIKSFLATQNLNFAKLKIYSDKDISKNPHFQRYKSFPQVEFHIFDVEEEIKNTPYENFEFTHQIKNHIYNPAYESDFFRLLMLYKHGGFYIDFDVLLLRDLSPLLKYDFLYQWQFQPLQMINGAIMHLKKDSISNLKFTQLLLKRDSRPGAGSVWWASDLYLEVKAQIDELVIFPSAFFNPEWQAGSDINHIFKPFIKNQWSETLYDGCFTWHWHNRWNEEIETGSKFDILDKKLEIELQKKLT